MIQYKDIDNGKIDETYCMMVIDTKNMTINNSH